MDSKNKDLKEILGELAEAVSVLPKHLQQAALTTLLQAKMQSAGTGGGAPQVRRELPPATENARVPLGGSFGEYYNEYPADIREDEKFLIAGSFAQAQSEGDTFTVKTAHDLLKGIGVKLSNAGTFAKQLMKKSGMIGQPVTVYGEERSPRRQWLDYYTSVLNSLGFKASEKVVNSGVYFTTIGAPTLKPQTGFGDWVQDFPNPWDFMQLFAGNAGSSLNYGYVNDPHYNSTLNKLDQQQPETVASQWAALDNYSVNKGYYAAFGHQEFPKFYSDRLNFNAGVLSVEYQTDLTSLQLK